MHARYRLLRSAGITATIEALKAALVLPTPPKAEAPALIILTDLYAEYQATLKAQHTFAVLSLMRGLPVTVLQKVLGHAKIQTTMLYAKVVVDFQHHEMRRI